MAWWEVVAVAIGVPLGFMVANLVILVVKALV